MKFSYLYIIVAILLAVTFTRCANQGAPMGGPKDSLAPVLLKTLPENKSLQFKENKIELVFDEYIKIENLKKQLIITPRLKGEYEYNVVKNRVELELVEPLEENTTYTFNFRDAIMDITEGNKAQNITLVFSTGTYLDSLELKGKVFQLLDGKKGNDFVVALYEASDTNNLFTSPPKYFTKTDTSGSYHLQNLKDGWYKLYTFADKNENSICEPQYESYGFKADTFRLSDKPSPTLVSYNSDIRDIKIISASTYSKYFEIRFNKYVKEYKIKSNKLIYSNLEEKNRNIKLYNPDIEIQDSIEVIVTAFDTLNVKLTDTLFAKFKESKLDPAKLSITYGLKATDQVEEEINFKINFNKPVAFINTDSIFLFYDSLNRKNLNAKENLKWNFNKTELSISLKIDKSKIGQIASTTSSTATTTETKPAATNNRENKSQTLDKSIKPKPGGNNKPVQEEKTVLTQPTQNTQRPGAGSDLKIYTSPFYLHFNKGAFISVESDTSEASIRTLTIVNPRNVASVAGKIIGKEESFTVQLLDKSYNVLKESKNTRNYIFKNIAPGDYFIRVMVDSNNNGVWDLGNINDNTEPERVIVHPGKLSLRANFEVQDVNIQL